MQNRNISVIRSKRKTVEIQIKPEGIILKVPLHMKDSEIEVLLEKKKDWIEKHTAMLEKAEKLPADLKPYTIEEMRALADKAVKVIPERVTHYAGLIGVTYGKITIRNQKGRWGSCSGKGNLNFNCLLMEMPDEIIDSVVVHELCHRKHMNHSPRFYAEVERVFPQYKKCHSWLKENGGKYLRRLPQNNI
ncbi:MAG: M48 family metallopeptidase [Acutalibacteraceae bacterium]|nr:M48 family metallopeptidase [Acutalibacteraceae bacterium]